MQKNTPPEWKPATDVGRWFAGIDPKELVVQHDARGRVYYPETLKRKHVKDGPQEVEILVRTPNTADRIRSRRLAVRWVGQHAGLEKTEQAKLTIEQAQNLAGAMYFEQVDTLHLLSELVYERQLDPDGEPRRYGTADYLDAMHPNTALWDLMERLDFLVNLEDPRITTVTVEMVMDVAEAMARRGNISPLLGIAGPERESLLLSMAQQLVGSATRKSSGDSSRISRDDS